MSYIVYSKDNCPQCVKVKKLLENAGLTYTEMNVPRDIDAIDFINRFKGVRTMPYIIEPEGGELNANQLELKLSLGTLGGL